MTTTIPVTAELIRGAVSLETEGGAVKLWRLIRDLPAKLITLCVGINIYGFGSLNARTLRSSLIGFISIIARSSRLRRPPF
ncbi:hypothetical protein [Paenibacillus hemerocallicola]|uniref:hypothetical protein n=1 Tax=Paenibacillus hemerocallicola TaxID=1172614 RepID=UPI001FE90EA7|nr:hypothetical protein [Paenibacillus hemerocallicola]